MLALKHALKEGANLDKFVRPAVRVEPLAFEAACLQEASARAISTPLTSVAAMAVQSSSRVEDGETAASEDRFAQSTDLSLVRSFLLRRRSDHRSPPKPSD